MVLWQGLFQQGALRRRPAGVRGWRQGQPLTKPSRRARLSGRDSAVAAGVSPSPPSPLEQTGGDYGVAARHRRGLAAFGGDSDFNAWGTTR
jgi:hypothetical protein